MMDTMRNAAKSWVSKLLIGLLAVSFGVWGIADVFRGFHSGALATVGSVEISAPQYSQAFSQYLQNLQRQTGQTIAPEDAKRMGIDRSVLNNLIQAAAVENEAAKMKLAVSDTYLVQEAMQNPAFQNAAGKFDPDQFKQLLSSNGISEAGYFAQERRGHLRDAITNTADSDVPVSKAMIEAQYRHSNEQRDARYFVVKTTDTEVAAPTDEEIRKEYESDAVAYTAPEYRSVAVMKAEPADVAARVTLTDEDLKAGYEKHKGDYFAPETRTVLQLSFPTFDEAKAARDKLAAGGDFLTLAKERGFSEADVTFAEKTRADFLDPAIADAAFKLTAGGLSEPVKGALATAILKVVSITPEHQSTLDEVKAQLSERLKLEHAADEIDSIYNAVEDARAAQTPFEEIAAKASIPFQLIPATDADGKDKDGKNVEIPHKPELLKAVFSSDVGVENDAISLDDGYIWYEVRGVVPAALRPFDSVKDRARAKVIESKVRALSEEKAKKLVEKLAAGAKFEDVAREAGAEIKKAQGLKRGETSPDFDPAAVDALFGVPEQGFAFALEPDGKGARIMQSEAVLLPAFDAASADAKAIADKTRGQISNDILYAYLGALQKDAGVSINENLWRQISGTEVQ